VLCSNAVREIRQMQRTFSVYAVVLCELRHSVIKNYEALETESAEKFKKSFLANVTTIALTRSVRKQSEVSCRVEWLEVCLPHQCCELTGSIQHKTLDR
jgi:hypothetical protein